MNCPQCEPAAIEVPHVVPQLIGVILFKHGALNDLQLFVEQSTFPIVPKSKER